MAGYYACSAFILMSRSGIRAACLNVNVNSTLQNTKHANKTPEYKLFNTIVLITVIIEQMHSYLSHTIAPDKSGIQINIFFFISPGNYNAVCHQMSTTT